MQFTSQAGLTGDKTDVFYLWSLELTETSVAKIRVKIKSHVELDVNFSQKQLGVKGHSVS